MRANEAVESAATYLRLFPDIAPGVRLIVSDPDEYRDCFYFDFRIENKTGKVLDPLAGAPGIVVGKENGKARTISWSELADLRKYNQLQPETTFKNVVDPKLNCQFCGNSTMCSFISGSSLYLQCIHCKKMGPATSFTAVAKEGPNVVAATIDKDFNPTSVLAQGSSKEIYSFIKAWKNPSWPVLLYKSQAV